MEPITYIQNPHSTELQQPEKWEGSGIKGFLRATQNQSLEQLKKVCDPPQIRGVWLTKKQACFFTHGSTCKVSQSSCFLCIDCSRDTLGYYISSVKDWHCKAQPKKIARIESITTEESSLSLSFSTHAEIYRASDRHYFVRSRDKSYFSFP
jgi:hypothetical protein